MSVRATYASTAGACAMLFWLYLCGHALFGCQSGAEAWVETARLQVPAEPNAPAIHTFAASRTSPQETQQPRPATRVEVRLHVLHVQVPRSERSALAGVWRHLREDLFDTQTALRLQRNGLRVGKGQLDEWAAVKAALDTIDNKRVYELPALRNLPGVPVAFEMDRTPRDQTVFYLDYDGVLSGDTWPESQKVLRVTYTLDTRDGKGVYLSVVPEIRQNRGLALTYNEQSGWDAGPRRDGRAFPAAAIVLPLRDSDFVLLAPGEKADLFGIVGGAYLTDKVDGEPYDSWVFVRAEVNHVRQRR